MAQGRTARLFSAPLAEGDRNMDPPETRYAKSGDLSIAYQVAGSGPLDLVIVPGFVSNLDVQWTTPGLQHFFSRLAMFSRLIRFDKRGTGLSDRMSGVANLEDRMEDVRAVMDAVGSQRAALFGVSEGGPMSLLFAATYPERASALVLYGSYARLPTEELTCFVCVAPSCTSSAGCSGQRRTHPAAALRSGRRV